MRDKRDVNQLLWGREFLFKNIRANSCQLEDLRQAWTFRWRLGVGNLSCSRHQWYAMDKLETIHPALRVEHSIRGVGPFLEGGCPGIVRRRQADFSNEVSKAIRTCQRIKKTL